LYSWGNPNPVVEGTRGVDGAEGEEKALHEKKNNGRGEDRDRLRTQLTHSQPGPTRPGHLKKNATISTYGVRHKKGTRPEGTRVAHVSILCLIFTSNTAEKGSTRRASGDGARKDHSKAPGESGGGPCSGTHSQ